MSDSTRRRLLFSLPLAALPAGSGMALASSLVQFSGLIQFSGLTQASGEAAPRRSPAPPQEPLGNFKGKSQNELHTDFNHCTAFPFDSLPLRYSDGGAPTRDILRGTIPTGELVELHETTVAPGKMPHPAHRHPHVEFILVREGTMDFLYQGGTHLLSPGSVGYTAPNELHGFRNAGTVPATYFIFSLGKH